MTVKELLSKYNGKFYIYENIYNKHGDYLNTNLIANHNDITNEIMNRTIKEFHTGNYFSTHDSFLSIHIES